MGTRVLQLFMVVLLTGCVIWASAIFFGPWALTKYLESQAGNAVEVSGLKVSPKLAMTASRIQISDGGAVTTSLRGVEVDWRLLRGDEPAVLISVANGDLSGSVSVEDLQITLTQAENGDALKISGTAVRTGDPNSVSAVDVKFETHTDYSFQRLRRVTATTGEFITKYSSLASSSSAKWEVDQIDLGMDVLQQKLSGTLALTDLVVGAPDLTTPYVDINFAFADGIISLAVNARDLLSETLGVAISGLTGSMDFDGASAPPAGPIDLVLNDFSWKDIRLPSAKATITLEDEHIKVSAEGISLGSEITIGRRYIGRAPDASFTADIDASSLGDSLQISGDARLAAAQQPVELDLSFQGAVANVGQLTACTEVACEIIDVMYEYNLSVAGETLSGTSRCREPTCSLDVRVHELSTNDTNKFFANLQGVNLISPLVLGGVYAQMLNGVSVGAGHKINF